ncbi:MAG: MFS transporter [Burkholderiales bacterium]|nr:MFS transporter [Burkholderiales bacterium]MDE2625921.1 MFS transporter [Burkholderiales bacterium]
MLGTRAACPRSNVSPNPPTLPRTAPVEPPAPLLTPGQFRAATAAVMMTILLAALDQTIVSVAVPTIARQLGGFEWMAWVISGYLIASTVVTPLYGRFSDLVGRRSVMSVAILIFLVASVGCALARTLPQLVLARVLQGAGGGGLIAMAQSVVADVVPLRERGRYQGYISIVWAVASMLGPVIGGVLTEYLSWPWIFWINLPLGLIALVLVRGSLRALPANPPRPRGAPRIDALGALLLLAGLSALLVPITRVGQGTAWSEPWNLAGWGTSALLLALFVAQQRRHPSAIVPMALFANRTVVACCALLFICFFNFIAMSVLVPLRLQLSAGFSAAEAALHLMPLTLAIPTAAFAAGRWLSRTGRVLPMQRLGVVLVPLALLTMGYTAPTGVLAAAALVVLGIGMGLQMPTTLITVQQSVPRAQIGTVTALTSFFRLLGGAIGIAVLSSVALLLLRGQLPADVHALGGEGLGPMLDAAHRGDAGALLGDSAFRQVMRLSALVSMASLWFVTRLPDLRLHDAPPAAAGAAAEL